MASPVKNKWKPTSLLVRQKMDFVLSSSRSPVLDVPSLGWVLGKYFLKNENSKMIILSFL